MPLPGEIQHASNSATFSSGTTGSVTVTISSAGAGHALVACVNIQGSNGTPSVSGIKTGANAENWASGVELNDSANTASSAVWVDRNTAGGGTSVVVTAAFGATASATNECTVFVDVFEFSVIDTNSPVDKTSTGATGQDTSTWSSGTTATTSQPVEVYIGTMTFAPDSGSGTITGPTSPWVLESTLSGTVVVGGTSFDCYALSGYQVVTATGTATYSGTTSKVGGWDAVVLTLRAAPQPQPYQPYLPPRPRPRRAVLGSLAGTFPAAAAPGVAAPPKPYQPPRARPRRGFWAGLAGTYPPFTYPLKAPMPPRARPRRAVLGEVIGQAPATIPGVTAPPKPYQPPRPRPRRGFWAGLAGTHPPFTYPARLPLPPRARPRRAVLGEVIGQAPAAAPGVTAPPRPYMPPRARPRRGQSSGHAGAAAAVAVAKRAPLTADYDGKSWWKKRWLIGW